MNDAIEFGDTDFVRTWVKKTAVEGKLNNRVEMELDIERVIENMIYQW